MTSESSTSNSMRETEFSLEEFNCRPILQLKNRSPAMPIVHLSALIIGMLPVAFIISIFVLIFTQPQGIYEDELTYFLRVNFTIYIAVLFAYLLPCLFSVRCRALLLGIKIIEVSPKGFRLYRASRDLELPWTEYQGFHPGHAPQLSFKPPTPPFSFFRLPPREKEQLQSYINAATSLGLHEEATSEPEVVSPATDEFSLTEHSREPLIIQRKQVFNKLILVIVILNLISLPILGTMLMAYIHDEGLSMAPMLCVLAFPSLFLSMAIYMNFNYRKCIRLKTDPNGVSFYDHADLMLYAEWKHLIQVRYRFLTLTCQAVKASGGKQTIRFPLCTSDEAQAFMTEWSLMTRQYEK